MLKKKTGKISLSTIFLAIAIAVIIAMGVCIYMLNNDKNEEIQKSKELQMQVEGLNRTLSESQERLNKNSDIVKNKNELSKELFSDSEIKECINNYLSLMELFYSDSESMLIEGLGFTQNEIGNESLSSENIRKTKIKYSDFKNKIYTFMTEECFNSNFNNTFNYSDFYKEEDGYLTVKKRGATGASYTLKSYMSHIKNQEYLLKVLQILLMKAWHMRKI